MINGKVVKELNCGIVDHDTIGKDTLNHVIVCYSAVEGSCLRRHKIETKR